MKHIVMYVSGIPFNGNTIKTGSLGGSESAAYYVAKELAHRGNRVVVFTESREEGVFDGVTYSHVGDKTEACPLGQNFDFYAANTPHDVLIIQRHPGGFYRRFASKVNILWAHDIGVIRNRGVAQSTLARVDRVLTVSQFHKDQLVKAWDLPESLITPIHNGVDYSLFEGDDPGLIPSAITGHHEKRLLWCSRPERGLNYALDAMEKLGPEAHLFVCGYEYAGGASAMEGFYAAMRERCEIMPNVTHLGALDKRTLGAVWSSVDCWMYPTTFEEVSCITAMEAMAAGVRIVASDWGALKETIGDYPNVSFIPLEENSDPDIDAFVAEVRKPITTLTPHRPYTWSRATNEIETVIDECFTEAQSNKTTMLRSMVDNSDILLARYMLQQEEFHVDSPSYVDNIRNECDLELELYNFMDSEDDYRTHYEEGTEGVYAEGESMAKEPEYRNFVHSLRYQVVEAEVAKLPPNSRVLDYGCAHGLFTIGLAARFPNNEFIGIDISPTAIGHATTMAGRLLDQHNAFHFVGTVEDIDGPYDLIILGEILEHVPNPAEFVASVLKANGKPCKVVITTPYGPWEKMSYYKPGAQRYHVHHFERADLEDMFAMQPDFNIACLPHGFSNDGEACGWYITTFDSTGYFSNGTHKIDFQRKLEQFVPARQTVSLAIIVRNGEEDLLKLLKSTVSVVDEFVIGIDKTTTDLTEHVIELFDEWLGCNGYYKPVRTIAIDSPVVTGFDEARNTVVRHCNGDWVLWGDADEVLHFGEDLIQYTRNSHYRGVAVRQLHYSVDPATLLKTDLPVRLFRNADDIRFLGVVHEHPESTKPELKNKGVGHIVMAGKTAFAHSGYSTEEIRRKRFERNIGLMVRDREQNPDRVLGKFLWMRDLSLMCRFELESSSGRVSASMRDRAKEGLKLWEELMECGDSNVPRLIKDGMEFYDTFCTVLQTGFDVGCSLGTSKMNGGVHPEQLAPIASKFASKDHLRKFIDMLIEEQTNEYENKYY